MAGSLGPRPFAALALGYRAAREGGLAGAVLNAANERAVESFLSGEIPFPRIAELAQEVLERHEPNDAPDLAGYVRAMERSARKRCALLIRASTGQGPMAEATRLVLGHPHDSANFAVAYNALLQMGIAAHVHVEDRGPWGAWTHASVEEAVAEVEGRLGSTEHTEAITAILRRSLEERDGAWHWPPMMRSMFTWWDVGSRAA